MNSALKLGLIAALVAARASIDGALHLLDVAAIDLSGDETLPCLHPPESRVDDLGTFGREHYTCGLCGKTVIDGKEQG